MQTYEEFDEEVHTLCNRQRILQTTASHHLYLMQAYEEFDEEVQDAEDVAAHPATPRSPTTASHQLFHFTPPNHASL